MGQQQVFLIVLGVLIAGMFVASGISAKGEQEVLQNWDRLESTALEIAADAQTWKEKPELFGGSPDETKTVPHDFRGVNFLSLGYAVDDLTTCFESTAGQFGLFPTTAGLLIVGVNSHFQNRVAVAIRTAADVDRDYRSVTHRPDMLVVAGQNMTGPETVDVWPLPMCEGEAETLNLVDNRWDEELD